MTTSSSNRLVLAFAVCAASSGCLEEQGSIFIEGVLELPQPDCTVDPNGSNTFLARNTIDLGRAGQEEFNQLILPLKVVTNLPSTFNSQTLNEDKVKSPNYPNYGIVDNNVVTFEHTEIFFSSDEDRGDKLRIQKAPNNENTHRETPIGGVLFNEQQNLLNAAAVFVTAITSVDAELLKEDFEGEIDAFTTKRIFVNVRVSARTTGQAAVLSPLFRQAVDICAGCFNLVCPGVDDQRVQVGDPSCFSAQDSAGFQCVPKQCSRADDCISGQCGNLVFTPRAGSTCTVAGDCNAGEDCQGSQCGTSVGTCG